MLQQMRIFIIFCLLLSVSCATPRKSRMALVGGSFGAGALLGYQAAPQNERPEMHGMYWASFLGLVAALIGEFFWSDEEATTRAQLENDRLKAELELINSANKVLLKQGDGHFKSDAPSSDAALSGKGKWRLYQTDRWLKEGPNQLFHVDKTIEILPEGKD